MRIRVNSDKQIKAIRQKRNMLLVELQYDLQL